MEEELIYLLIRLFCLIKSNMKEDEIFKRPSNLGTQLFTELLTNGLCTDLTVGLFT